MARRTVAGLILIGLGLGLFGSQLPPSEGRLLIGGIALVAWVGPGLAILSGHPIGRWLGLAVATVGLVVAAWAVAQANVGDARLIAETFFLADGPKFSWAEVAIAAVAFAVLSGLAGALLILPLARKSA